MYGSEFIYRLQFYNDLILYDDVNPQYAYNSSAIVDFKRFLPFVMRILAFELDTESLFMQTLQKTGSRPFMHCNGAAPIIL